MEAEGKDGVRERRVLAMRTAFPQLIKLLTLSLGA